MRDVSIKSNIIRKIGWVIFTFAIFSALVKLAHWQYSRAIEKQARLSKIAYLKKTNPITLAQVVALANNPEEDINDMPIELSAKINNDFIFLLDNQVHQGQLGYRVFQIAQTEHHGVLVNLGWVLGNIDRTKLPEITPILGEQQFKAHVRVVEQGIILKEDDFSSVSWPQRVQQIDLSAFNKLLENQLKQPLLPFVAYVDEAESIGYQKSWQPIVMPPEKHQAYAFQWFCLAIAWLLLMAWVSGVFTWFKAYFQQKIIISNKV
ncbi:SURF1 family protein [Litorilituus lipolyticus]|uniref:SURF1 family protein n=1 Tax=Litorilituus lipolyticus TaxID=2491017 RepID=UPI001478FDDA|nr:SURF1 family protein [Litorilituus lipolyticus]